MPRSFRIAVLLLVGGLVLPGAAAAAPADPTAPGPLGVTRVEYDAGDALVGGTTAGVDGYYQSISGSVHIPTGGPTKLPVLLFLHGRHATCAIFGAESGTPQCPELPGLSSSVDSFKGYDYLAENLASHGYIVASIDANEINGADVGSRDAGTMARAQIIAKNLDVLADADGAAGPGGIGDKLIGRVDLSRLGIMGHSRGGEGVTQFIEYNRRRPADPDPTVGPDSGPRYPGLKAVFALAPIDAADQAPTGVHLAELLPLCDGDVSTLAGNEAYERTKYDPADDGFSRTQFNVQGANHNYFNTIWTGDDESTTSDTACSRTGANAADGLRLAAPDERDIGTTLIPAYLRRFVGPEPAFDPYVTGEAPLPPVACAGVKVPMCSDEVQVSYRAPQAERRTLVAPAATDPGTVANTGGAITATGFSAYGACDALEDGSGCPIAGQPETVNRSMTRQLSLVWDAPATLAVALDAGAGNASPFATLNLRTASNYADTARNPRGVSQDFDITLVDAAGDRSSVHAIDYARGALRPDQGSTDAREVILGGLRVPLAAFTGVDASRLRSVEFGFGSRTPKGSIQLADVSFQEPARAVDPPADPGAGSVSTTGGGGNGVGDTAGGGSPDDGEGSSAAGGGSTTGVGTGSTAGGGTFAFPGGASPAGPSPTTGQTCRDRVAPRSRFTSTRISRRGLTFRGRSADRGCSRLARVRISLARTVGKRCRFLTSAGRFSRPRSCLRTSYLTAGGTSRWRFSRRVRLPRGRYKVVVRGIDGAGNRERKAGRRTFRRIVVR